MFYYLFLTFLDSRWSEESSVFAIMFLLCNFFYWVKILDQKFHSATLLIQNIASDDIFRNINSFSFNLGLTIKNGAKIENIPNHIIDFSYFVVYSKINKGLVNTCSKLGTRHPNFKRI